MDKSSIIQEARKLFYDLGADNVTFKTLAEQCNIAPSLITYYFGTKSNLMAEVVGQYSHEISETISEKLYTNGIPYDVCTADIASLLAKLEMYENDEKARNFYLSYLESGIDIIFATNYQNIYKEIDRYKMLDINRSYDQLSLVAATSHGLVLNLIYAFFTGKVNCTFRQFEDYLLYTRYKVLNMPQKDLRAAISNGKLSYQRIKCKLKPYFVIE